MPSPLRHALLAAAAATFAVTAHAQQPASDTTALPPVVITATRVALPQAAPTISTTVLTGDALRAQGITTVQDALAEAPDVFVPRSGSYGAQTSLFVRGGNSDYAEVLVDGVPVNDPGGAIDLANLSTDNVDRIEIVRGPASVLYGANAVSGVIQIFTRDGGAGWRASAGVRGGTYDSRDVEASVLGGGRHMSGSLAVGDHRSDGIYAFNNGNRNSVASGLLRLTPDTRSSIRLALRYGDARADIPTNYYGVADDSNQFHTERRWIGSVDAGRFLAPNVEARVLLGATEGTVRSADLPDTPGETCDLCYDNTTTTSRRSADARLNFHVAPELLLTAGGAYEWQHERITGSAAEQRTVHALYAQALGSAWRALSYTAGVRRDDNSLFGSFTTYRVSGGYALHAGTHAHASFGTAFKEPTFDQMLSTSPFARGNPALRPEHTRSWDAGVSQTLARGAVTIGATYFSQRFRDMIQYLASPPEAGDPNYVNLGGVSADGVEYTAALRPAARWDVTAGYTHLRTRVADAGEETDPTAPYVTGERLLRRPNDQFTLTVGIRPTERASLSAHVTHVGNRADVDFQNFVRVLAPSYTTVDLSGEFTVLRGAPRTPDVALTVRVENVMNVDYTPIYGFRAPGRAVLAGVRVGVQKARTAAGGYKHSPASD